MFKNNKLLMMFVITAFSSPLLAEVNADDNSQLSAVVVNAKPLEDLGNAYSSSAGTVSAKQLEHRPLLRPAEVLESVPGLTVTQHSGDGKANQYFLRGFNLDHGSDFSTFVMGMPVNMVSHAHGQGYMDLNFLIPELVGGLRYNKGVYAAEDGDFSSTGSARIDYKRNLSAPFVNITQGENQYRRALAAGSREWNDLQWLWALELAGNDGPWNQPENLHKTNAVLSVGSGTKTDGFSLAFMGYSSRWVASEHVPQRAIDSGEIGRFGTLTPNDGGKTHRVSLSGEWAASNDNSAFKANAWLIDYGLNLYSSPSGYTSGSQGDQHEQADHRSVTGGQLEKRWFAGESWANTEVALGTQLRHDRIGTSALYNTVNRDRTVIVRQDEVRQTASALYAEANTRWLPWLRSSFGVRYDYVDANVNARGGAFNISNGGSVGAGQTSPKLGLVVSLASHLELYANWGQGFHSNDSRGATTSTNPQDGTATDAVPLLVKSIGSELGLRATPLSGWQTSVSLWQMKVDSELVFIGDEGVTEPRGSSHRHGIEWTNHVSPWNGFFVDADVALSKARFDNTVNDGRHVPNAIPVSASVAATLDDGYKWSGGLRLRYIGAYDLEEAGSQKSTAFMTANAKLGYRVNKNWQLSMDVLNLFDRKADDIEYWGGACSKQDGAACNGGAGIDGRLVHPLEPRTLRAGLRYNFN